MNIPIEKALDEFAIRSGLEDIRNFAKVVKIAKRSGGELVSIINQTTSVIGDKIRVKEEILTMTAARRFEQMIMNIIPAAIIIYIDITSPGFFVLMYTTIFGRVIMSICVVLYGVAIVMSQKILDIEI